MMFKKVVIIAIILNASITHAFPISQPPVVRSNNTSRQIENDHKPFSKIDPAIITLPGFFSDNMVLQRNTPIHLWGKGIPGRTVKATLGKSSAQIIVEPDSSWRVFLRSHKATTTPQSLIITSEGAQIILNNILIGDVWICSGQSNMEWMMQREMHFRTEVKDANQPLIRFCNPAPAGRYVYGVAYTDSLNKRLHHKEFYLWTPWQTCDSSTVQPMSAVAYYYAKSMTEKTGVPIGLVNLSIGGAPIETFISRDAMKKNPQFADKVKPGDWLHNDALPKWIRERAMQNLGNNPDGFRDELGLNHAYKPGFAYESGVKPLLPMPVTGVIWYQGESNSLELDRVNEYRELMHVMIDDYRAKWNHPEMPFYWVQLSSIDTTNYQSQYWPQFRDEQRKLMDELKNGGMAVCSDIGSKDNVHPANKKEVGERLARWALRFFYQKNVLPSGPLPFKASQKDSIITISFQYGKGLKTSDGKPVRGFSLDGKNEVPAIINKGSIVINTKTKAEFVYYAWKPYTDANLINEENLPASTFKMVLHNK